MRNEKAYSIRTWDSNQLPKGGEKKNEHGIQMKKTAPEKYLGARPQREKKQEEDWKETD